ncbi:DUF2442 domain-containing protein [Pseudoduganella sp. FT55W]|uniref:DUF2442 domain-containing protein n=1 Tax=Duganella rivi TaxID=2666083 RepID=A0A7X4GRV4_9BURK|nr:DUF2442 domain-containing protein [Duganella rivi]MYM68045.1 DUF2442 domain-containing protein [Duganella rivi]
MDWDVTDVRVESDYAIWVRFKDGVEGMVKFMPSAFRGVFSDLRSPAKFSLVSVVDGVVTWPGELDLAPDAMHEQILRHGEWVLN